MSEKNDNMIARAVSLIDLTNLNDDCTAQDIEKLCAEAMTPAGPVAAVCVWPRFISQAKRLLGQSPIGVATVVNFPAGGEDIKATMHETKDCIANGADEIELVMPHRAFAAGNVEITRSMIHTIRATTDGSALLKVILEAGELREPALIGSAAQLALGEGADFISTSTALSSADIAEETARIMLQAVHDHGDRPCGIKVAGSARSLEDAASHLRTAGEIMGPEWATRDTFRFGASGLLTNLLARLDLSDTDASDAAY